MASAGTPCRDKPRRHAFANYYDSSCDAAGRIPQAWTGAFERLEDVMQDFFTTGKLDWRGFADYVIAEQTRMIVKQQITGPLSQALGSGRGLGGLLSTGLRALFGGGGATVMTQKQLGSSFASDFSKYLANAKGNVFDSPGLSAYSGQIVSKPTVFPFAKGVGLMGEVGPEAIMPLKRTADGRLGVEGGGGRQVSNTINIKVDGAVDSRTRNQIANDVARQLRYSEARFN